MIYRHVPLRIRPLFFTLPPLLMLAPALAYCAGPAYAQTTEAERHITPTEVPPGTNLDMGVMYHEPLSLQQKNYRAAFSKAMVALSDKPVEQAKKQPVFAILVNADRAAKEGDFEGAGALVKAAMAEIAKLR